MKVRLIGSGACPKWFYCAGDWIDADLILGDAGLLSSPWEDKNCYLIPSENLIKAKATLRLHGYEVEEWN